MTIRASASIRNEPLSLLVDLPVIVCWKLTYASIHVESFAAPSFGKCPKQKKRDLKISWNTSFAVLNPL
jgi:hypothetical protein